MRKIPSDTPEQLKFGLGTLGLAGICLLGYSLKHYFAYGIWDIRTLYMGFVACIVAYLGWKFAF